MSFWELTGIGLGLAWSLFVLSFRIASFWICSFVLRSKQNLDECTHTTAIQSSFLLDIFQMYLCCLTSIIGAKSKLDLRFFCNAHRTEKHHCLSLNANLITTWGDCRTRWYPISPRERVCASFSAIVSFSSFDPLALLAVYIGQVLRPLGTFTSRQYSKLICHPSASTLPPSFFLLWAGTIYHHHLGSLGLLNSSSCFRWAVTTSKGIFRHLSKADLPSDCF